MHRFTVQTLPEARTALELPAQIGHQIARVLRLRPGEDVALLDGSGREVIVRLTRVSDRLVEGMAGDHETPDREPRLSLELVMGMPRHDRWELILQKVTELGVSRIQPVQTSRCVVRVSQEQWQIKRQRWERIIIEAVEQCGRTRIPMLQPPASVRELAARGRGGLMLHTAAGLPSLRSACAVAEGELSLLVGPEAGLDEAEASVLSENGWRAVSMGPRTLRCETAAMSACAIALSAAGDLGG